jgi:hypothetical protein
MGKDLDLPEACIFENAMHPVGVREGEWAWRFRIMSRLRRQICRRRPKRQYVERVLFQRSPADESEPPLWPKATANVDERRGWISEKHDAKPREGRIE